MSSKNLTDKYRPATFADLLGQGAARQTLEDFAAAPHPGAFLFTGPPGVGKTSAARVLANELGCHPTTGIFEMSAGDTTAEDLDRLKYELRFAPFGTPWRVIIVDECDYMGQCRKAKLAWLSILDDLPTRTIFVFTTNHPEKLEPRFLERTERCDFASDANTLTQDAALLVARIWQGEGMAGDPPQLADLPGVVIGEELSFRRVVRALEPLVRTMERFELRAPQETPSLFSQPKPPPTPVEAFRAACVDKIHCTVPTLPAPVVAKPMTTIKITVRALTVPAVTTPSKPAMRSSNRSRAIAAFLDGCTTRPSANSLVTQFGCCWKYARKVIEARSWDKPIATEAPADCNAFWSDYASMMV